MEGMGIASTIVAVLSVMVLIHRYVKNHPEVLK